MAAAVLMLKLAAPVPPIGTIPPVPPPPGGFGAGGFGQTPPVPTPPVPPVEPGPRAGLAGNFGQPPPPPSVQTPSMGLGPAPPSKLPPWLDRGPTAPGGEAAPNPYATSQHAPQDVARQIGGGQVRFGPESPDPPPVPSASNFLLGDRPEPGMGAPVPGAGHPAAVEGGLPGTAPGRWLQGGLDEARGIGRAGVNAAGTLFDDNPNKTMPAVKQLGAQAYGALPKDPTDLGFNYKSLAQPVIEPFMRHFPETTSDVITKGPTAIAQGLNTVADSLPFAANPGDQFPQQDVQDVVAPLQNQLRSTQQGVTDTINNALNSNVHLTDAAVAGAAVKAPLRMGARGLAADAAGGRSLLQSTKNVLSGADRVLRNEPLTGAGALRTAGGGLGNLVMGAKNLSATQAGKGLYQLGLKAPLQTAIPTLGSGVAAGLDYQQAAADPVNKFNLSPGHSHPFANIATMTANSLGMLSPQAAKGVPTIPQWLGTNVGNLGREASGLIENPQAARRIAGNAVEDTLRSFDQTGTSPKNLYKDLTETYSKLPQDASGLEGLASRGYASRLEEQTAKIPSHPTASGLAAAKQQLVIDASLEKLKTEGATPENLEKYRRDLATQKQMDLQQRFPNQMAIPTERDLENAKVQGGQMPDVNRTRYRDIFNSDVSRTAAAVNQPAVPVQNAAAQTQANPAAPLGQEPQAEPIPGGGAAPSVQPNAGQPAVAPDPRAAQPAVAPDPRVAQQPSAGPAGVGPPPVLPPVVDAADPTLQARAHEVGQKLGEITSKGIDNALAEAKSMPAPEGLQAYWHDLPDTSKILAIAGLSIAAISAFRSMFGSDEKDEDPSFLMKVLPYLGIGAAAWGLGGGTIGLEQKNLPQMQKYKDLGNAAMHEIGQKPIFDRAPAPVK